MIPLEAKASAIASAAFSKADVSAARTTWDREVLQTMVLAHLKEAVQEAVQERDERWRKALTGFFDGLLDQLHGWAERSDLGRLMEP